MPPTSSAALTIMRRPAARAAALAAVPLLLAAPVGAQSGEHAPLVAQLPGSARALGLAGAYVAVRDVDAILHNPSLLAAGRAGAAAAVGLYGRTGALVALDASVPFGARGLGISVRHLSTRSEGLAGGYPLGPDRLTGRGSADATSTILALGGALTFKGIRWGAAVKYVDEWAGSPRHDATAAADLGASKDFGPATVGLAVQDIGPDLELHGEDGPLPARVTAGLAGFGRPVGPVDLGLSAAVSVRRDGRVAPAAGIELAWIPIEGIGATGRIGARRPDPGAGSPIAAGLSFGFDRLNLDYGFEGFAGEGSGHHIGVRIR